MANIKALYGKYLVTMQYPQTFQELAWRVSYMRRNRASWRLLTDSFKPSTTNYQNDQNIKDATYAAIDRLEFFYESAATIDPFDPITDGGKFLLRLKRAAKPALSSAGLSTDITTEANTLLRQYTRIQARVPVSAPGTVNDRNSAAAENIPQDIEKIQEGITAILNSYGSPYVETRGATCTKWVFNSRNTAFKAISLITQEYPWIMQIIKEFNFFVASVKQAIVNKTSATPPGLAPDGVQLYGHLESSDDNDAKIDSPRHLLTPLWTATANIDGATDISSLGINGTFKLKFIDKDGNASDDQDLLLIYCNDTYEQNAYFTNKPV